MSQDDAIDQSISVSRLATKKQSLDDMYSVPANFLEIDVINPQTTIIGGKKKYTDYEVRMRVSGQSSMKSNNFFSLLIIFVVIEMPVLNCII